MSRHIALFPIGGLIVAVGFRNATMRFSDVEFSSSKSPSSFPNGSRDGRSRLVQLVRMEMMFASGSTDLVARSTNDRNMSAPSSLGRFDGLRLAIQ